MQKYKVHENQNLFDIAAHVYADSSLAIALADANNLSLTAAILCGAEIIIPSFPKKINTIKAISARNIIPATSTPIDPLTGFRYQLQFPL